MARSLNKVQLIGNLTRDPELRYTPQGTAVCTFGLATNRTWMTDDSEKHEEAEFHRIVAWNKLAELCAQLLFKGRRTYVEGRLQTRQWTGQDGLQRKTTEIIISDMILLDSRQAVEGSGAAIETPTEEMPTVAKKPAETGSVSKTAAEAVVGEAPGSGSKPADDKQSLISRKLENKKKAKTKKGEEEPQKEAVEEKAEVKKEDIPF